MRPDLKDDDSRYDIEEAYEYRGVRVAIVRQYMGFRCGYVGVPETMSAYSMPEQGEDGAVFLEVHGSVTYEKVGNEYPIRTAKRMRWFGFDCNHFTDVKDPNIEELFFGKEWRSVPFLRNDDLMWSREMVRSEVEKLARQLINIRHKEESVVVRKYYLQGQGEEREID